MPSSSPSVPSSWSSAPLGWNSSTQPNVRTSSEIQNALSRTTQHSLRQPRAAPPRARARRPCRRPRSAAVTIDRQHQRPPDRVDERVVPEHVDDAAGALVGQRARESARRAAGRGTGRRREREGEQQAGADPGGSAAVVSPSRRRAGAPGAVDRVLRQPLACNARRTRPGPSASPALSTSHAVSRCAFGSWSFVSRRAGRAPRSSWGRTSSAGRTAPASPAGS